MTNGTSFIMKAMHVIFWIIFIGLCIKTGAILYSYFVSLAINPIASQNLYMGLNLSGLHAFSIYHYSMVVISLIMLTGLKAYIAYMVVRIFMEMKIEKPFSEGVNRIISKISAITFWTAIMAIGAHVYCEWLMEANMLIPINWAHEEMLFFAGVIYIIATIFRKGIELQSENELTV